MPTRKDAADARWLEHKTTYGEQIKGVHTTVHLTMADNVAERLKFVHPKSMHKIAPDTEYLSANLQSYKIVKDGYSGLSYIKGYRLPMKQLHRSIQGSFSSHQRAHEALVAYLRTKDKPGRKSVWPGR